MVAEPDPKEQLQHVKPLRSCSDIVSRLAALVVQAWRDEVASRQSTETGDSKSH